MLRKKFILASSIICCSIITCVFALSLPKNIGYVFGADSTPTIKFNASKNTLTESSGEINAKTELGNIVSFAYSGTSDNSGGWATFSNGGSFYNKNTINGLKSISITSNTDEKKFNISYSHSYSDSYDLSIAFATSESAITFDFNSYEPNYFRISTESECVFNEVILTYSCQNVYQTVALSVNDSSMGTVTGAGSYKIGSQVSVVATPTNDDYGFVGWYDDETLKSSDVSYNFVMPSKDVNLSAQFKKIFKTSSTDMFIWSCKNSDNLAKTLWTNYSNNSTGAYEYKRGTLDIRNEGLDFHIDKQDYLAVNDVLVDSTYYLWTIDVRGHGNGAKYNLSVNGNIVTPKILSGNATLDSSTLIANTGWSVVQFDLTSYIGQYVSVKIQIIAGGDSMVGGFYFDKVAEPSTLTTADAEKFIPSTYGNDTLAKSSWTAQLEESDSVYTTGGANIGDQGLSMHENNSSYALIKDITVNSTALKWYVDLRSFGTRNSQFYLSVNDETNVPTISACQNESDEDKKASVDSDGKIHVNDGWTTVLFDLSSYVNQKVTLKIYIVAGGDAMVGGFYFGA